LDVEKVKNKKMEVGTLVYLSNEKSQLFAQGKLLTF